MPKKYLFYCIAVLLLIGIGIYGFIKWSEAREKVNLWTLVPNDAVFIVESANHAGLLRELEKADLWDNIAALQSVSSFSENIALLDSVSGRKEGASRFLQRKTLLTSLHVVSRRKFDYVFYVPINTVGEHRFVRTLVENVGKSEHFTAHSYNYQNQLITQVRNKYNGDTFSFFSFHNNIIISANAALVKEIVRKISRGQLESPAAEYGNTNYLEQPGVYAQVFVNYRHLPLLLNIFLQDEVMPDVRYFASLGRSSLLALRQQAGRFLVEGFSRPEPLSDSFHNRIKGQQPQAFALKHYLPERTAMLLHLGLSQPAAARHRYPQDAALSWPAPLQAWADSLAGSFGQELGIAYLEAEQDSRSSEKILFARTPAPLKTQQLLHTLTRQAEASSGQRAATGRSGPYAWKQVPVKELPLLLFGSPARGFETCYVSQVDSFMVFAPDLAALRLVLNDIRAGRVWGQTASQQAILGHTQQESTFGFYLNTRQAWKMLTRQVQPGQRSAWLRHETLLKKLSQAVLQFSRQQDQYRTRFLLSYPLADAVSQEPAVVFDVQQEVRLADELQAGPWLVSAPGSAGGQLLWQDRANRLLRLQAGGAVTWNDSLEQAVTSPIYPLGRETDKPGKYLFAAGNTIHCLDQNGREAPNFPFILPDTLQIAQLAVLNLNHGQQPRLLFCDQTGNLFMLDMAGNLQEGWEPKSLEVPLAAAPQHFRINGRDVVLVMLQNGYVYAFTSRGDPYPGFPINLDIPLRQQAFGVAGSSLRQTRLTVLSPTGKRVIFTLTGQVLGQKQLPASRRDARFELLAEPEGKSYIISRQEQGKVSLYDQNLRLLLEKNFITSSRKIIQYFDFGPLNRLYVLTETGPGKTYLYNYQAQLIGQKPIDNRQPVIIQFTPRSQRYVMYSADGKSIKRISFRDK